MQENPIKPGLKLKSEEQAFFENIKKTATCWMWLGTITKKGYGQIKVNGCLYRAHRLSWILHYGPIPKNKLICHVCDNPPCVNPSHLFCGTSADNNMDKTIKKRGKKQFAIGYDPRRGKLSPVQVKEIRGLYKPRIYTQEMLAEKYDISSRMIFDIIHYRFWNYQIESL